MDDKRSDITDNQMPVVADEMVLNANIIVSDAGGTRLNRDEECLDADKIIPDADRMIPSEDGLVPDENENVKNACEVIKYGDDL